MTVLHLAARPLPIFERDSVLVRRAAPAVVDIDPMIGVSGL